MKTKSKLFLALMIACLFSSHLLADELEPPAPQAAAEESNTNEVVQEEMVLGIPREILDQLPPKEVVRLAEKQVVNEYAKADDLLQKNIVVVAIISVFSMLVAIVLVSALAAFFQKRMLHMTVRRMVEKGVPIPPEMFQPEESEEPEEPEEANEASKSSLKSDLRNGLIWIAIGVGSTWYFVLKGANLWPLGLIPLLIGVAFLITSKIEGSKNQLNPE